MKNVQIRIEKYSISKDYFQRIILLNILQLNFKLKGSVKIFKLSKKREFTTNHITYLNDILQIYK